MDMDTGAVTRTDTDTAIDINPDNEIDADTTMTLETMPATSTATVFETHPRKIFVSTKLWSEKRTMTKT